MLIRKNEKQIEKCLPFVWIPTGVFIPRSKGMSAVRGRFTFCRRFPFYRIHAPALCLFRWCRTVDRGCNILLFSAPEAILIKKETRKLPVDRVQALMKLLKSDGPKILLFLSRKVLAFHKFSSFIFQKFVCSFFLETFKKIF